MPGDAGAAHGRAGRREHECHDEQRAEEEQQPVTDAEPALVLAGGIEEIAHGREHDGRRFAPLDQVQQERHTGGEQAGEQPGMEERHAGEFASTTRNAWPNGVSVTIRWYLMPLRRHAAFQPDTAPFTVLS